MSEPTVNFAEELQLKSMVKLVDKLTKENAELKAKLEQSEQDVIDLKHFFQLSRTRAEQAEAKCLLWSATFQKYESFLANGLKRVTVASVVNDYQNCERATDCGKPILARVKRLGEFAQKVAKLPTGQNCPADNHWLVVEAMEAIAETGGEPDSK